MKSHRGIMDSREQKLGFYVGKICLIVLNIWSLFLIYGYAFIACSGMPDNLLGVNYEPSGIQMLYYVFVVPVFMTLSLTVYLIKKYITRESKLVAVLPFFTAACFYMFLEVIDWFIHFPAGNELFYQGSLILALIFSMVTFWVLLREVKTVFKERRKS